MESKEFSTLEVISQYSLHSHILSLQISFQKQVTLLEMVNRVAKPPLSPVHSCSLRDLPRTGLSLIQSEVIVHLEDPNDDTNSAPIVSTPNLALSDL